MIATLTPPTGSPRLHRSSPLARGLKLWYPAGDHRDGVLRNRAEVLGPGDLSPSATGKSYGVASFGTTPAYDGTYRYSGGSLAGLGILGGNAVSGSAWFVVFAYQASSPNIRGIFGDDGSGTGQQGAISFRVGTPSNQSLLLATVKLNDSTTFGVRDTVQSANGLVPLNTPCHGAFTWQRNGQFLLYFNGRQAASASAADLPIVSDAFPTFAIGDEATRARYFNGLIGEVALWERALLPEEVFALASSRYALWATDSTATRILDFAGLFGSPPLEPPTLSLASLSAAGWTLLAASVTTNTGSGTLYAVVTGSATAPSAAQVKAGQDHTGAAAIWSGSTAVAGDGVITLKAEGLTPSTSYYAHFVHTASSLDSTVASSAAESTQARPTPPDSGFTIRGSTTTLTDAQLWLPLTRRSARLDSYLADGTDLEVTDAAGGSPLHARLRRWAQSSGLDLVHSYPVGSPFVYGTGAAFADWNRVDGLAIVRGEGSVITGGGATASGRVVVNSVSGEQLLTWTSPNNDYIMFCNAADIDGDGTDELLISTRRLDHSVVAVNSSGTTLWTYEWPTDTYGRGVWGGKVRDDIAGLQVLATGNDGCVALLDADGNPIWERRGATSLCAPSCEATSRHTVQDCVIADLDGTAACYFVYDSRVYRFDGTGTQVWASNSLGGPVSGGASTLYAYGLAAGRSRTTTEGEIVAALARVDERGGKVACVDNDGTVLWEKWYPWPCWSVASADINGDGLDEWLIGFGTHEISDPPALGFGGVIVLDGQGNEISLLSLPSSVKAIRARDNGSGRKDVIASTDGGQHVLLKAPSPLDDSAAVVRAVLPSLGANEVRQIRVEPSGVATIPTVTEGDYFTFLGGADGGLPSGWTNRNGGTWSLASGWLRSPSDGDTGNNRNASLDATEGEIQSFEIEFDARFLDIGTGTATDYYVTLWYRASGWSSGIPNGYQLLIGQKGRADIHRMNAGSGTPSHTVYGSDTAWSGVALNTTFRVRLCVSQNYHAVNCRVASGDWQSLVIAEDTNVARIESAGAVAVGNSRGQVEITNLSIRTFPSVYATEFNGPSPLNTPEIYRRGVVPALYRVINRR